MSRSWSERLDRRLGWGERKLDLEAGRYEVVLPPDAVADLMVPLGDATSGREAEEGRSVFSAPGGATRVGESLSPHPFSLAQRPVRRGPRVHAFPRRGGLRPGRVGLRQRPAARADRVDLATGGSRACSTTAREPQRSGVEPAALADNLILELPGATSTLDDLVGRTERGLLLTCLWYIREVDPATLLLTGLTRDGVYLVEHGEIVGVGQQLPLQREPRRPAARRPSRRDGPNARSRGSGTSGSTGRRCRRCGWPSST